MESDGEEENGLRIRTPRLVLRPPHIADAAEIAALANNWGIAKNLARLPYPYRVEDALQWIAHVGDEGETAFVVTLHGGGPIGACGIAPTTWTEGRQIGYWLGEPYWGCGYATEAARAIIDFAFSDPALDHLWCSCRVTNHASRDVIHKCGFQFHGAGMMHARAVGAAVAVEHYCLDRAVWAALGSWRGRASDAA